MNNLRKWKVIKSERVFDTRWAKVQKDACELPSGLVVPDYYYWVGGDFAQVFAVTRDDEVVLVRQYKHGVKEVVLELPAGLVDKADADPLAAAKRELREETGFEGSEWQALNPLNVSSAKATTRAYPFIVRGVEKTAEPEHEETEPIESMLVDIPGLLKLIGSGEIRDSSSVAISFLALRQLRVL